MTILNRYLLYIITILDANNKVFGLQHRTSFSKFNVNSCLEPSAIFQTIQPTHRALQIRPRQNSMFAGGGALPGACGPPVSGHCTLMAGRPRKAKSAADIKSLVQHECSPARTSRSMLPMTIGAAAAAAVAERRVSCVAPLTTSTFGGYGSGGTSGGSGVCGYGSLMVSAVKERRSCSLFPSPGAEKRLFSTSTSTTTPPAPCLCDVPFGGQSSSSLWASAKRDFLMTPSTSLGGGTGFGSGGVGGGRRTSCGMDHLCPTSITLKDRRPSFNNVIAQVTAERRPSSSMLRISNV